MELRHGDLLRPVEERPERWPRRAEVAGRAHVRWPVQRGQVSRPGPHGMEHEEWPHGLRGSVRRRPEGWQRPLHLARWPRLRWRVEEGPALGQGCLYQYRGQDA